MDPSASTKVYGVLGATLFLATFGISSIFVIIATVFCFIFGFLAFLYIKAEQKATDLRNDFASLSSHRFPIGIQSLLENKRKFEDKSIYEQIHSMTGSAAMDAELEQILNYMLRDYIDPWYNSLSSDELFRESLKRTTRRSISAFSHSMKQVDWVPFITTNVVDDFASHLRLFRMATEKAEMKKAKDKVDYSQEDILTHFFDFEFDMEKNLCRDLLSTMPHYENAYLHDLVDIVLYLIMPPEDFRCRPLRFLLREVIVRRMIVPLLDRFSDPFEMNQLVVWLLSEVSPKPEDFVQCLEKCQSVEELDAIFRSVTDEKTVLRGKDSGGEQGTFVKQQLGSLDFIETVIKKKMVEIADRSTDMGMERYCGIERNDEVIQLPIHVVLTSNLAVSYFVEFLQTVGGQNYIDCYLAIEGFKVSVEHQVRYLSTGDSVDDDVFETVKEAAQYMYQQYLSQEAITRVELDENVVARFLARLRSDGQIDFWFDEIQEKIVEILRSDEHFYPEFKRSPLYVKMLTDLGIITDEERSETPCSEHSVKSEEPPKSPVRDTSGTDGETITTATVETLGIGQQGKQSFALYNVRVARSINDKKISNWNVLRRYSDFHLLHSFIIQKYPSLASLAFPGKKTFNNLDSHFLEKRTKALNQFLESVLQPNMVRSHPELEKIVFDFLSQKEYVGTKEPLAKKMMSAMFDPIKMGVKAVGSTVMAVPEQMIGGVSKIGTGINNATKSMIPNSNSTRVPIIETDRVAASLKTDDFTSDSIPLRVLVLFVDEVFGVRARNAWFRRQMIMVLRQLVLPFGNTLNKKIVDMVHWLTSEQQVTLYISALRQSLWPDGRLAEESPPRSSDFQSRTKLLAQCLMLSCLPEQLRLILGNDTSYQGIKTISDALQNRSLNRRLLYVLLERLLITIFPENRFEKIFAQLHSKSPRAARA